MSSEPDTDDGHVHTPVDAVERADDGHVHASDDGKAAHLGSTTAEPEDGFGRKGWVLTAAVFVSLLVIPAIIYAYPYVAESVGLTFFGTYLLLPLIPAVLLGTLAVWSLGTARSPE